jgi:hypothetical protein
VLLRALVIVFIVLFCFASVLGSAAFFAHRSRQLLEEARTEIRERNTATGRLLLSP